MNYWCHTCGRNKGASGADECVADGHCIVPAKDREQQTGHEARIEIIKLLGYGPASNSSAEWIVSKVEAERTAFRAEIASLREALRMKIPTE